MTTPQKDMTILLKDILPIANTDDYKIHFARYNQDSQPLEAWVRGASEWQEWQEYRPGRNDFNKPYIFSLMQFHHETDTWLFGGVFEVLTRPAKRYDVNLTDIGEEFIGRLKIKRAHKAQAPRTLMEPYYGDFEVQEILPAPYSGI